MMDEIYLREAIKQAKRALDEDEVPVGAVIVHAGQIIARAYNQVETLKDPTAHAEMIAITQATSALGSKWLYDCTMYVTLEPCSMCSGALILARMKRLVFGAYDPKTGACGSVFQILGDKRVNHVVEVSGGILQNECGALLTDFFKRKRASDPSTTN